MPKRIKLDPEYIARIRESQKPIEKEVQKLEAKKVPCKYCGFRSINKYNDLTGHFSAFCPRCGEIAVYNAEDYRHYSYRKTQADKLSLMFQTSNRAI